MQYSVITVCMFGLGEFGDVVSKCVIAKKAKCTVSAKVVQSGTSVELSLPTELFLEEEGFQMSLKGAF